MSQDDDRQRTKQERIERLRERTRRAAQDDPQAIVLAGVLLGVLDLLADEL